MDEQTELKIALAEHTGPCLYPDLEGHLQRGVVFFVAGELELLEVAVVLAQDKADQLAAWIEAGLVGRPGEDMIDHWQSGEPKLQSTIVRPWVLVQESTN